MTGEMVRETMTGETGWPMFETTRFEAGKRIRGTLALTAGVGLFGLMVIGFWPSFEEVYGKLVEGMPEFLVDVIGTPGVGTVEGFLVSEFYWFVWILLLGLYFAYSAGELIAGDVETGRMDLLLSMPISRSRVVAEKFASLLVPIVALNAVVPAFVYGGLLVVGETVDPVDLAMLHVLSIPYLLTCAAVGLVFSVLVGRASVAQRLALGAVFALFLVETVASAADVEWAAAISPMRYYSPAEILVYGEYDYVSAGALLGAAVALVVVSQLWFRRVDID